MLRSYLYFVFWLVVLNSTLTSHAQGKILQEKDVINGAASFSEYLPLLKNKKVAIVSNLTGKIGSVHLVDTLIKLKVNVVLIFGPEHGFRGEADAGEKVQNNKDPKTGIPVISLYGKHNKPTKSDLKGVDVVIYDIQDVGVRFYTYITTMSYVMEACANYGKKLIVLDRPNPNGHYVDGPVLDSGFSSFLGLHKVPIVYGMTCGEYAQMVNGEGWLPQSKKCDLVVVKVKNYTHLDYYQLPIKPSPNLPNMMSVYFYPSLGLFEGTVVSMGRGTEMPFQVLGHPNIKNKQFSFTPKAFPGAKEPKFKDQMCYGFDLRRFGVDYAMSLKHVNLLWLEGMYLELKSSTEFFDENFNAHAGTDKLQKQIKSGIKAEEISRGWQKDIDAFKKIRKKYLLYKDFY
ncbi:MAG: exo-beta-N-acetylmuramidase NamZ domain-containing protein [Bacteroidota bacterium]